MKHTHSTINKDTRSVVAGNVVWLFGEKVLGEAISIFVAAVLARVLLPSEYGVVAIASTFIAFLSIFITGGWTWALIQKRECDELDYSSVFIVNTIMSVILYVGIYLLSPMAASYFGYSILVPVLRVTGLSMILTAMRAVQTAMISRQMQFKRFFLSSLAGTIGSAIVGIIMAYRGFGVWALVAQKLTDQVIDMLVLQRIIRWRPKLFFSRIRISMLFAFGWKIMLAEVLSASVESLKELSIGKVYSTSELAFFNKGSSFPKLITSNINVSISRVMFPVLSRLQNERERLVYLCREYVKVTTYLLFPINMGLAIVARPLIILIFTDRWLGAVPFLQISCFIYACWPIQTAVLDTIKAIGRSDIYLIRDITVIAFSLCSLFALMHLGPIAIALSGVISTCFAVFTVNWIAAHYLGYHFKSQIKDQFPAFVISAITGLITVTIGFLDVVPLLLLVLQVGIAVTLYIGMSAILKVDSYHYCIRLVKDRIVRAKQINQVEGEI